MIKAIQGHSRQSDDGIPSNYPQARLLTAAERERTRYVVGANFGIIALPAWLLLSPAIFNYEVVPNGALANGITATLLIVAALLSLRKPLEATPWSCLSLALGIWLAIAPFALGYPFGALWNNLFVAPMLGVLATFSIGEASGVKKDEG